MSTIKSAALTLSLTLCFLGVVMMLSPKGNINKSFKSFVSICIVAVLVLSVLGVSSGLSSLSFRLEGDEITDVNSGLQKTRLIQEKTATESAVKNLITEGLRQKGITDFIINVNSDISEDNSIYITDVIIKCQDGQSAKCYEVLNSLSIKGKVEEGLKNGS